jgi:hypothetical protein
MSDCILCGNPVTCGQRDAAGRPAHYGCLGMCTQCYQRPASGCEPFDWCSQCIQRDKLAVLLDDDTADRSAA